MTRIAIRSTAAAATGLLVLGACGGGSSGGSTAGSTSATTVSPSPGRAGQQGGAGRVPGVSGLLAAISGRTLQVQSTNTQTAVTYTGATTITDTVAARVSDVRVGWCASVRPTTTPTATAATDGTGVTARSVALSRPLQGQCARGMGAFDGTGPRGARPSGSPSVQQALPGETPPSSPGGARSGGFGAFGRIMSVSGTTFAVASARPGASGSSTPSVTNLTVTTTGATMYTRTVSATASALSVGTCVAAFGKADDTGTVAATTIAVRPRQGGSCNRSFGRAEGSSPAGGGAGA
jgi:hypothetical protein